MNTLQKSLLVAGVLGLGSAVFSPVSANPLQSYATGSSSIVLMNGASQSIGAEIGLPRGQIFSGSVTVTPVKTAANLNTNATSFTASPAFLFPGAVIVSPTAAAPTTVEAAVATLINSGPAIDVGVSYTRAWQSGLQ